MVRIRLSGDTSLSTVRVESFAHLQFPDILWQLVGCRENGVYHTTHIVIVYYAVLEVIYCLGQPDLCFVHLLASNVFVLSIQSGGHGHSGSLPNCSLLYRGLEIRHLQGCMSTRWKPIQFQFKPSEVPVPAILRGSSVGSWRRPGLSSRAEMDR